VIAIKRVPHPGSPGLPDQRERARAAVAANRRCESWAVQTARGGRLPREPL